MRKSKFSLLVAGLAALFLTGAAAKASATTFNLTDDHCTGGCGPSGVIFGTVTLLQNGLNVDITVHLNSPYKWARTGAADELAFKFNAVGVVLADISVNQTWAGHTLAAVAGSFNGDGTGPFGFGIQCTTCGNG